jgi:hypothetical protein
VWLRRLWLHVPCRKIPVSRHFPIKVEQKVGPVRSQQNRAVPLLGNCFNLPTLHFRLSLLPRFGLYSRLQNRLRSFSPKNFLVVYRCSGALLFCGSVIDASRSFFTKGMKGVCTSDKSTSKPLLMPTGDYFAIHQTGILSVAR